MIEYDMTWSDLMMKIGSQLWLVIMLILVLWSEENGAFPANNVRKLLKGDYNSKPHVPAPAQNNKKDG